MAIKIGGQLVIDDSQQWYGRNLIPNVDGTYDLGTSSKQWQDLWIDGIANIDILKADALGANLNCADYNMTNVDIDTGNIASAVTIDKDPVVTLTGAVTGNGTMSNLGSVSIATTATSDPTITLQGAVTGTGTLTNLGNATITTTATSDPVITLTGAVTGTGTMTNLGNVSFVTTIANDAINSQHYYNGSIDNEHIADNAINSEHYADNSIDALHLNVSGNGTTSQFLRSDGNGTFSWATPTNTTYSAGSLLDLSSTTFNVDLSELPDGTGSIVGTSDELVYLDNSIQKRKRISEITLSDFNNDSSWTSNTGDITNVSTTTPITGGGTSGSVTIAHSTSAGYKHIPSGGGSGQFLKYSSSGTATWSTPSYLSLGATSSTTYRGDRGTNAYDHISASGSSHSYINQSVTSSSSPTFSKITCSSGNESSFAGDVKCDGVIVTDNVDTKYRGAYPSSSGGTGSWGDGGYTQHGYLEVEINGSMWGWHYWASSERFKDNINDMSGDISSLIWDLRPAQFNWKADRSVENHPNPNADPDISNGLSFGLIAEEVELILPSLVSRDRDDLPFTVNYANLSVFLLAEMKKEKAKLEEVTVNYNDLKTKYDSLEARLNVLENI